MLGGLLERFCIPPEPAQKELQWNGKQTGKNLKTECPFFSFENCSSQEPIQLQTVTISLWLCKAQILYLGWPSSFTNTRLNQSPTTYYVAQILYFPFPSSAISYAGGGWDCFCPYVLKSSGSCNQEQMASVSELQNPLWRQLCVIHKRWIFLGGGGRNGPI